MVSHIVIVESPAKAKTLNKYLGSEYLVLASYGHIRDLPSKEGSVLPQKDFAMKWSMSASGTKHMSEIRTACKGVDTLILATDPDREGEAISWHIVQDLKQKNLLKGKTVQRVVFYEITRTAVTIAFKNPRDLNTDLIDAYLARRALDYLVGFTLSPVLWRKLPGARSAGRVQSVALRLICERETEIENFIAKEFWTLHVPFVKDTIKFTARLTHNEGKKLDKFSITSKDQAHAIKQTLSKDTFTVSAVDKKQIKRNPYPPFITSTLQQEASKKLRYSPMRTMKIAQKLYEGIAINGEQTGIITYMRTDGTTLSQDSIASMRTVIRALYGDAYLPKAPRLYKSKVKNSQEAHEAIRPTDIQRTPNALKAFLSEEEFALYDLIWKRAMASQMESAVFEQTAVDMKSKDGNRILRANAHITKFDGFLCLYTESVEDVDDSTERQAKYLPPLKNGDMLTPGAEIEARQSFTTPPPRYSEASIIKTMEDLGIGRPSTYTTILKVLQDRKYVSLESRRFIPCDQGRIVTVFLSSYFDTYFNYTFTSTLEGDLDKIATGKQQWKHILQQFWTPFSTLTQSLLEVDASDIRKKIDKNLGEHFFPTEESRKCPLCQKGRIGINFGKYGIYVSCDGYPDCKYSRPLEQKEEDQAIYPKHMGTVGGKDLLLKKGPYGVYLELEQEKKAKRMALPPGENPQTLGYERAVKIISLPRTIGVYTDKNITASIGRFGPFLRMDNMFFSVPKGEDIIEMDLHRASVLIADGLRKKGASATKIIGQHPKDNKDITVQTGRYGPYIKWGKHNAPLPKNMDKDTVDLAQAIDILQEKIQKNAEKKPAKSRKKSVAKKEKNSNVAPSGT